MTKLQAFPAFYRNAKGFRPVVRIRRNGRMVGTVVSPFLYETAAMAESAGYSAALKYALNAPLGVSVSVGR